jgi:HSP20 family molecular chaperone IbpA
MALRSTPATPVSLPELEGPVRRLLAAGDGYPPCDVLSLGDGRLRIALAVAGFAVDELCASVEGDQLLVRGRRQADPEPRCFLYRGIAMRRFQRTFVLGAGLRVTGARLENGLLNIELERVGRGAGQGILIAGPGPGA